jgi:hypothetical protein
MSIQSWKWRNIEYTIQFIIYVFGTAGRGAPIMHCNRKDGVNCRDWTRFPDPLWRHSPYGQVGSPSNPDLWRKRPNAFRTFRKDHRTWPSRMEQAWDEHEPRSGIDIHKTKTPEYVLKCICADRQTIPGCETGGIPRNVTMKCDLSKDRQPGNKHFGTAFLEKMNDELFWCGTKIACGRWWEPLII